MMEAQKKVDKEQAPEGWDMDRNDFLSKEKGNIFTNQ